jgi:HD-GYP domain-containing protein (c-di-GMP phosphodiesterase class II)
MIPDDTFAILSDIADTADSRAGNPGHSQRVTSYVSALLPALHIGVEESRLTIAAARLHDIGKLGLPEEILNKPTWLTPDEWTVIRTHPQRGADYLSGSAATREIADLVLYHHERMDGTGYPHRLRGSAIPLGSRIIAVADSFDAMTHDRPYRKGLYIARAMAILAQEAGTQWDRGIVAEFLVSAVPSLLRHGRLMVAPELMAEGLSA